MGLPGVLRFSVFLLLVSTNFCFAQHKSDSFDFCRKYLEIVAPDIRQKSKNDLIRATALQEMESVTDVLDLGLKKKITAFLNGLTQKPDSTLFLRFYGTEEIQGFLKTASEDRVYIPPARILKTDSWLSRLAKKARIAFRKLTYKPAPLLVQAKYEELKAKLDAYDPQGQTNSHIALLHLPRRQGTVLAHFYAGHLRIPTLDVFIQNPLLDHREVLPRDFGSEDIYMAALTNLPEAVFESLKQSSNTPLTQKTIDTLLQSKKAYELEKLLEVCKELQKKIKAGEENLAPRLSYLTNILMEMSFLQPGAFLKKELIEFFDSFDPDETAIYLAMRRFSLQLIVYFNAGFYFNNFWMTKAKKYLETALSTGETEDAIVALLEKATQTLAAENRQTNHTLSACALMIALMQEFQKRPKLLKLPVVQDYLRTHSSDSQTATILSSFFPASKAFFEIYPGNLGPFLEANLDTPTKWSKYLQALMLDRNLAF